MRCTATARSASGPNISVTSSVVSMKANTRTRENCWRSACTSMQGEVAETGDRTGHVAQHDEFGAGGVRLLQHHVDGHAAGGHRLAQRLAQVDLAATRPAPPRGQPGGQRARQRVATTRRIWRSCSPEARRNSTFSASCGMPYIWTWSRPSCSAVRRLVSDLHHLAQLRDPLGGNGLGDLLLRRRGLLAVAGEQSGQQPALELVQCHRLERLIRRVRRPAAGAVPAERLDDLGDHGRQAVVDVPELRVVRQHLR